MWSWAARGARDYDEMSELPAGLRDELAEQVPFSTLGARPRGTRRGRDRQGAVPTGDGRPVEAVLMRYRDGEALDLPVLAVRLPADLQLLRHGRDALRAQPERFGDPRPGAAFPADRAVDNCVFMGMGEPMINLDNVLAACAAPACLGVSHRRTAISTVGWIPGIERLAVAGPPVRLALSLHARRRGAALASSCRSTTATRSPTCSTACRSLLRAAAPEDLRRVRDARGGQ